VESVWPDLPDGSKWIAAQVKTESDGDPDAKSRSGAVGLLQLMGSAANEMGLDAKDRSDARLNLMGGVGYLKKQHDVISQMFNIPQHLDRLIWAFAAYNAGRGYIVQALLLAERDGQPEWQRWDHSRVYLFHRSCTVQGKYPDYHQAWNYVQRIQAAVKAAL
jgi:membrane-bound lytic murein transglycosylase MltF